MPRKPDVTARLLQAEAQKPLVFDEALMEKVRQAPRSPGCYLFSDKMGFIIYVGKSKMIASRVRQYFHPSSRQTEKIACLVREIADVAFSPTPSETDALLLEYHLIKTHRPWFNAQLKRDPRRFYLRLDFQRDYPTITVAHEAQADGATYFGCFFDSFEAKASLETINKLWRTPLCGRDPLPSRTCLYWGLGACAGPCEGHIPQAVYREALEEVAALMEGDEPPALRRLSEQVDQQVRLLAFEKAQVLQKQLSALERLRQRGLRPMGMPKNGDVLVAFRAYREAQCTLFYVQGGAATGRVDIPLSLSPQEREALIPQVFMPNPTLTSSPWMAGALLSVYGDKLFYDLPKSTPLPQLQAAAAKLLDVFLAE